jgi:ElaB/YqjD/DUF883 family membrane-anchored ribosome-binding protein
MCIKCADALSKHYPHFSEEEQMQLLYAATSFPFGDGDYVAQQIEEARNSTDGSLAQARAWMDEMVDKAMENRDKAMENTNEEVID